jgi:RecJ-like exonuclease
MKDLIEKAVKEFRLLDDKPIRLISHLDCDGLSSASIIVKALKRENKKFVLSIVKQLNENVLKELSLENYSTFIFTDLGSGYIKLINNNLKSRKIFIFDHHVPDDFENYDNIIHVNPHLANVENASEKISGSGVTYLFAKSLNNENKDISYIAVIGSIGDMQNFEYLNKEILEDAINEDKIEVRRGLKMFGSQTKPLHKILQFSVDPFIPGVTGSEEGAINFLSDIGINIKENNNFKKLVNLNEDELKKLTTGIILKRLGSEKNPADVFCNIYLLKNEDEESVTKDAREFSTLLNCCGRMNKPSIGIGVCLNNKRLKEKASDLLREYKIELINSLSWFHNNKDKMNKGDNFVIINAQENIKDTLIGTITSIISKSNIYKDNTILISMAYTLDNNVKISARLCNGNNEIDLREILKKITKDEWETGGHKNACGCLIPIEKENEFIQRCLNVLNEKIEIVQ